MHVLGENGQPKVIYKSSRYLIRHMLDQERSKILCQVIMVLLHTMCHSCKTRFCLISLPVFVSSLDDAWVMRLVDLQRCSPTSLKRAAFFVTGNIWASVNKEYWRMFQANSWQDDFLNSSLFKIWAVKQSFQGIKGNVSKVWVLEKATWTWETIPLNKSNNNSNSN